jgi:hypothetical protein
MTLRPGYHFYISLFAIIITVFAASDLLSKNPYYYDQHFYYLFPFPEATEINPYSDLIFKHKEAFRDNSDSIELHVVNHHGEMIMGKILLKENNHTLIFLPDQPFKPGDIISVHLSGVRCQNGNISDALNYSFQVRDTPQPNLNSDGVMNGFPAKAENKTVQIQSGFELPEGYPYYEIGLNTTPTPDQYYFQASEVGQFFQLITDNKGIPYFYKETPTRCLDFKVNKNGYITYFEASKSAYVELDSAYRFRRLYKASMGYATNNHELLVMPDGNYWTINDEYLVTDMSQYVECGNPQATVIQYVIEEKDADNVVLWQWRTVDHFNIMDGDPNQVDFCNAIVIYAHVNSIAIDPNGDVLISSRKLNELTKIDKNTGEILWRLGGVHNQFTIVGDPLNGFTDQHMAREDELGKVTVFDNGNYHNSPHSRGVSYAVDTNTWTATYINGYDDNNPVVVTNPMGSMQTLENGNVVIGWTLNAQEKCLTEYQSDGTKVLEMHQTQTANLRSYRSLKYPWKTTYFYPEFDTVDFGFQNLPGNTTSQPVNVVNPNAESIVVTGSYFSINPFSLQTSLPVTIPGHSSQEFVMSFHPLFDGEYNDYAYLMTQNDTSGISIKLFLKGSTLQSGMNENVSEVPEIYPNPLKNQVSMQWAGNQACHVVVYHISGTKIANFNLLPDEAKTIQTEGWRHGCYIFEMKSGKQVWHQKLIKQ